MARKFSELYNKMSSESRANVEKRVAEYKAEMRLDEVRKVRNYSQVDLARNLGVPQGAISKIERRGDMHVGTLRRHVEAMGGSLELRAVFPDANVSLRLRGDALIEKIPKMASMPARKRA